MKITLLTRPKPYNRTDTKNNYGVINQGTKSDEYNKDEHIKFIGKICQNKNSLMELTSSDMENIKYSLNDIKKTGSLLFKQSSTASIIYASVLIYAKFNNQTLPASFNVLQRFMRDSFE